MIVGATKTMTSVDEARQVILDFVSEDDAERVAIVITDDGKRLGLAVKGMTKNCVKAFSRAIADFVYTACEGEVDAMASIVTKVKAGIDKAVIVELMDHAIQKAAKDDE